MLVITFRGWYLSLLFCKIRAVQSNRNGRPENNLSVQHLLGSREVKGDKKKLLSELFKTFTNLTLLPFLPLSSPICQKMKFSAISCYFQKKLPFQNSTLIILLECYLTIIFYKVIQGGQHCSQINAHFLGIFLLKKRPPQTGSPSGLKQEQIVLERSTRLNLDP